MTRLRAWKLVLLMSLFSSLLAQAKEKGVDVNDVTVLFPLGPSFVPKPEITLESGTPEAILPPAILKQVLDFAKFQLQIARPIDVRNFEMPGTWHVVAFRYDPCAPDDGHGSMHTGSCMQELRLVMQPMMVFQGPGDTALHLLYTLGSGLLGTQAPALLELVSIKNQLAQLMNGKITTEKRPLGINPYLQAGVAINPSDPVNPQAQIAQKLYQDYVLKYARPSQLSRVTMMGLKKSVSTDWVFFGGDIVGGKFLPSPVANLSTDELSIRFDRSGFISQNTQTKIEPLPLEASMSTAGLFQIPAAQIIHATNINQAQSFIAHRIENPKLSDRTQVDCMSCHTVTGARMSGVFQLAPFSVPTSFTPPARITGYAESFLLQSHATLWNLRNLGYFSSQPSLSQRTVNESAVAAGQVNRILGLESPGKDCTGVEGKVTECLQANLPGPHRPSVDQCLAICRE